MEVVGDVSAAGFKKVALVSDSAPARPAVDAAPPNPETGQ
jgi:hypothetical protein